MRIAVVLEMDSAKLTVFPKIILTFISCRLVMNIFTVTSLLQSISRKKLFSSKFEQKGRLIYELFI